MLPVGKQHILAINLPRASRDARHCCLLSNAKSAEKVLTIFFRLHFMEIIFFQ